MTPRTFAYLSAVLGGALCTLLPCGAQQAPPPAQPLPLKEVVLFSSGVGYFQRAGRIEGSTTIPLSFRAEQLNDILKSLVLFDPAGSVRPVSYAVKDAAARRLGVVSQALDRTTSLGTLLRQFQGARLRLELGGEAVEGRLVSVNSKPVAVKEGAPITADMVNLLTESGLRSVPLESVTQVKLLDARLEAELRESLELLARGLDEQRQGVELRFGGQGAREVKAGYLQETPVWKTSYRLVLDKGGKPYLQGWAIVENTTEEDWKDVRLSLVSGRPVSFLQDLYQPLYVPRPVVQAQVIGSPTPQTYGETLTVADRLNAGVAAEPQAAGAPGPPGAPGPAGVTPRELAESRRFGGARKDGGGFGMATPDLMGRSALGMSAEDMGKSVVAAAQGAERGEFFEYAIQQPVSIARGQAAMVPIVTTAVEGEAISIYDATADPNRALSGFRLRNTTGLHLSGGPLTVFRDGGYAGDAQINQLQPGEERLLSYAVDLELTADHEVPALRQEMLSVTANSGVLLLTRKQRQEQVYTFRNKGDAARTVLVQQDKQDEFKLVEPAQPLETTPDEYRFKVSIPAGKTATLKVVTERPIEEKIALLDLDLNAVVSIAQNGEVSQPLRAALKQLVTRREKIVDVQRQRGAQEEEIKAIDAEQTRIRQNMAQLDRNSPLYGQYVKKLTEQEEQIERARAESKRLREAEAAAQKELRAYLDSLTVA